MHVQMKNLVKIINLALIEMKKFGAKENAGNQHFLRFPQCFLFYEGRILLYTFSTCTLFVNAFNPLPHNREYIDPE